MAEEFELSCRFGKSCCREAGEHAVSRYPPREGRQLQSSSGGMISLTLPLKRHMMLCSEKTGGQRKIRPIKRNRMPGRPPNTL